MASSVTVTAKAGPAEQATAVLITGVTQILFDMDKSMLQIFEGSPLAAPRQEFDLTGVTTVTFSISGLNYTVTVS